jgi:hypothetical protein
MKVIAPPGRKCPMEGKPRDFITDETPVEVPGTGYYLRLIADGSLSVVSESPRKGGTK